MFGFNLIDLLFVVACIAIGAPLGRFLASGLPEDFRSGAGLVGAVGTYLVLVYPFYRGLRRFPMVHPRCPCCRQFQPGFHILAAAWPRVVFQCPSCKGEFVIWHNGKPGDQETWETPVLALKWPYAFGIYRRMKKPTTYTTMDSAPADSPGDSQANETPQ
jgi:hypothetical protein